MSLVDLARKFPNDRAAERWFVRQRWPNGIACHHCGSTNVQTGAAHRTMPFRCRDCRKRFSVKSGTIMESSKLGYRVWAFAFYMLTTNLRGVPSMKLARDLGTTQKSAWFLAHRIRAAYAAQNAGGNLAGPIEVDEVYIGGRAGFMHARKRAELTGRGGADKEIVVGIRDRESSEIRASVVESADGPTLRDFVHVHAKRGARIYSDDATAYKGLRNHATVAHSAGEYGRGDVHVNGIEGFWSRFRRGIAGSYFRMSREHLQRYVDEFAGRQNMRDEDTLDQMAQLVRDGDGRRLKFEDLITHDHGQQAVAR